MPESTGTDLPQLRRAARFARYATVILLLGMFIGTHIPADVGPHVVHTDKLAHTLAFMALTCSLLTSWELSTGVLRPQHYFAVWLFGTLYGAFDEITQTPVGRVCDLMDWLADIGGILIGLVLYQILRPVFFRILGARTIRAENQ